MSLQDKYDNEIIKLRNKFDREHCIKLLQELKRRDEELYDDYGEMFYDLSFKVFEILFANDTLSRNEYDEVLRHHIDNDVCGVAEKVAAFSSIEAKNNFCHTMRNNAYSRDSMSDYMICVRDLMDEGIDHNIVIEAFNDIIEYL